jgi:hypothetical protein
MRVTGPVPPSLLHVILAILSDVWKLWRSSLGLCYSCYFFSVKPKYSPRHFVLKHPKCVFSPQRVTHSKREEYIFILSSSTPLVPITVAMLSEAKSVFVCSNTRIVGLSTNQGIAVCLLYICVELSCVGSVLATARSLVQGVPPTVYKIYSFQINSDRAQTLLANPPKKEEEKGMGTASRNIEINSNRQIICKRCLFNLYTWQI